MHVRSSRGRGGKWATTTSTMGWPDLVAVRGPHLVAIELKTDAGVATDDQLLWLRRFSRVVGGRAWLVRPSDPTWETFVTWLRHPVEAPRLYGVTPSAVEGALQSATSHPQEGAAT